MANARYPLIASSAARGRGSGHVTTAGQPAGAVCSVRLRARRLWWRDGWREDTYVYVRNAAAHQTGMRVNTTSRKSRDNKATVPTAAAILNTCYDCVDSRRLFAGVLAVGVTQIRRQRAIRVVDNNYEAKGRARARGGGRGAVHSNQRRLLIVNAAKRAGGRRTRRRRQ